MEKLTLVDGCSWYPGRLNVSPFGGKAALSTPTIITESLGEAYKIKREMLADGVASVLIYDTVEGTWW